MEWSHTWDIESLKAGGQAVKDYGWYWVKYWRGNSWNGECYDVSDRGDPLGDPEGKCKWNGIEVGCYQEFDPNLTWDQINRAIDVVRATPMLGNGSIFEARYSAGDQVCGNSDGYYMTQWGSKCWADSGKSWEWIVAHYYYNVGLSIINDYNLVVNASFESGTVQWDR